MHSLDEILKSRRFHPSIQARLESGQATDDVPGESASCGRRDEFRAKLRAAVLALMDSARLDALAYPTWSNPPRLIGDLNTPGGDNSQLFSPSTGFPGDHGADGLHARRRCRRPPVCSAGVERTDAAPARYATSRDSSSAAPGSTPPLRNRRRLRFRRPRRSEAGHYVRAPEYNMFVEKDSHRQSRRRSPCDASRACRELGCRRSPSTRVRSRRACTCACDEATRSAERAAESYLRIDRDDRRAKKSGADAGHTRVRLPRG
jgi:hypothetical protein